MALHKHKKPVCSRRDFLRGMRWAPVLFVPAPMHIGFRAGALRPPEALPSFAFTDLHVEPQYPTTSPLDDVLRLTAPGSDEFVMEKYAFEIAKALRNWTSALRLATPALEALAQFLDESLVATPLTSIREARVRSEGPLEIRRRQFVADLVAGRERFLQDIKAYLAVFSRIETAEIEIIGIRGIGDSPATVRAELRYDFVGTHRDGGREERIGGWDTRWTFDESRGWRVTRWEAAQETASRSREPIFVDVTVQALGHVESYNGQLLLGVDDWRTKLDGASGIDIYGNNGLAIGDFDNDGFDDLYVCQPAGLPNRLYRNRGDGTFEDVTEKAGVAVLDATACALFADFENKGAQDLLVISGSGPLLFLNDGTGKFALKRDAFRFARAPQGMFTHAAIADYDGDGRLDIYFCLYSYYVGLDQYRYPVPYFDACNGPPNFLLHNEGNATFQDRTEEAGLNIENDRYSFACAWGDSTGNGRADLYVANDFGRSNLYVNNGDGIFRSVAREANVEQPGAGMSVSWLDFDNDGKQDIYVGNMWSPAGMRVSAQDKFRGNDVDEVRKLYRQHARGNSLYENLGTGRFSNVAADAGVEVGRWAWCSDAWDFDHDGYSDLYIANGYISGPENSQNRAEDLSSFFWRQVVANSPPKGVPSGPYEQGWNAINELVRSDASWNGHERNVFYANNGNGTFSEVSGVVGLDFPEDSRAFALADLDHDGRLEVMLKNRNAPQIRILRNGAKGIGNVLSIRLRGTRSNRDSIGAAVTVEAGALHQTKYVQAGSGFLSQHSKELFFGVGKAAGPVRITVRWPAGSTQSFAELPVNRRIEIVEGEQNCSVNNFLAAPAAYARAVDSAKRNVAPTSLETWLIEPLRAADFSLQDLDLRVVRLRALRGSPVLLYFWTSSDPPIGGPQVETRHDSMEQWRALERQYRKLSLQTVRIFAINVDRESAAATARSLLAKKARSLPTLFATPAVVGVYNIFYRYLFDRRRDLPLPTSFLLDENGMIVKVYQGALDLDRVVQDAGSIPRNAEERLERALPFPGTLYGERFQRNEFTYGVALFQRGYLEQAAASFRQVIAAKPNEPEAYYNLGTLYLRKNASEEARQYLEQAVRLRPNYPEAWNNLGMIAAQDGQTKKAIHNFEQSLLLRSDYVTALVNLGNVHRREGNFEEGVKLLKRALELEPENAEANYNLGMLYARQEQLALASRYLQKAVESRPDYPDALNNLGVFLVREQRYPEAEDKFKSCIRAAPNFDQAYLNLARLYVILDKKEKARGVLEALLKEQPQHRLAQQALEVLH